MKFWKRNKKTESKPKSKAALLHSLQLCCSYFERNMQQSKLFEPEFETSKRINIILTQKDVLSATDVAEIVSLMDRITETDHYDGSGWFDYRIQLCSFLSFSGYEAKLTDLSILVTGK